MGRDHRDMNRSADKKTAFVTGASYGVGAATALALARDGFDVAVSATRAENLDATTARLAATGVRVVALVLDLGSQSSIERAMAGIASAFGHIDLLVNNAGSNLRKLAVDVTWAEWDAVLASNLRGAFFLSQQVGRHLIAGGRAGAIVNIASTHALVGAAERSTYGIAKGSLIQMTRMLAIEWAEHGIRVNAIAPGRLDTRSPSRAARTGDPSYMQAMLARIPLGRLATVDEVAAAVCYLAGPQGASITGQTLVLDGGITVA
jgi:NAD(P)-dependent dehydrogenase (short-subunit alcohol dehydrogenase family)